MDVTLKRRPEIFSAGMIVLAIAVAGAACIYGWSPSSFPRAWTSATPEGFYNELGEAMMTGHLHLRREPDPRLVSLSNPYDPARNGAFRVNDLSYFQGKYYLYMGAAPAITAFIPFRILTGRYLSEPAAAWCYCVMGMAAACTLVLLVWRIGSSQSNVVVVAAALLAVTLANGFYGVIQGSISQHVTIAAGFAFSMLSLLFLAATFLPGSAVLGWFSLASTAYGCAIASRPNYLFGGLLLLPPLLAALRDRPVRCKVQIAAASLGPASAIVCLILTYNEARFGHPFEFGQRYQLGSWNQLNLAYSGFGQVAANVRNFLFGEALVRPFFPFVTPKTWIAAGILRFVPWLWLAPLAVSAVFRPATSPLAKGTAISALILGGANFCTLVFLPSGNPLVVVTSANGRYLLDFLPALLIFVSVGTILASGAANERGPWWRRGLTSIVAGLALASAMVGLSLNFGRFPRETYRPLARLLNWPSSMVLSWRGDLYGPLRLRVKVPEYRTGAYEPLVATGTQAAGDLLLIHYEGPTTIRVGYVSTGFVGPLSTPISLDSRPVHTFDISMGSLYPPDGHPALESLDDAQVAYLRRHVAVSVDGRPAFTGLVPHHDSLPSQVVIGQNPVLGGYSSRQFTGDVESTSRTPLRPPPADEAANAAFGPIRIDLHFPIHPAAGTREPLLVTGVDQAGDFVTVEYAADGSVRFALDHWGGKGANSDWIHVDPHKAHRIEISMGSLYPATLEELGPGVSAARFQELKKQVVLTLDRSLVLDFERATYDSSPFDTVVGFNVIGGSTCTYAFRGKIDRIERLPPH